MHSFGSFLVSLVVASSSLVGAIPAPAPSSGGQTATLKAVYQPGFNPDVNMIRYRAHLKYGVPIPANLTAAYERSLAKRQSVENGTPDSDITYLTPVDIGTPPQRLNLLFDTGSSDLWVFSSETPSREVKGQDIYDPSKSSTAKEYAGEKWSIGYEDKSGAKGDAVWDMVSAGSLTVDKQAVELATSVSDGMTEDTNLDGILGLGADSGNTGSPEKMKTWFSNIIPKLKEPLVTVNFNHEANGTFNFGFINEDEYSGEITYTRDISDGSWVMETTGYAFGNQRSSDTIRGFVDTGTSALLLPSDLAEKYYSKVEGSWLHRGEHSATWVYPCDSKMPDFTFFVEEVPFTVPGSLLVLGSDSGRCTGGIQTWDKDFAIFGAMAIKTALVVYDRGNNRIGWAKKP